MFLVRFELLDGLRIVAGHLFLAHLELLDPLVQVCDIVRNCLEQPRQLWRHLSGCRREVWWRGLSQRSWLLRHCLDRGRRALMVPAAAATLE